MPEPIDLPIEDADGRLYITGGAPAYAGHYVHEPSHPVHTHAFVEIAVVTGGTGMHRALAGRQPLGVGDVILLRPGVWHGYEDCRRLDIYNCCFSTDLLLGELAWCREDPLLGYLLWTGPHSMQRRGMLTARLDAGTLAECVDHLDALARLRDRPLVRYRGDVIGRLALVLSSLARAVAAEREVVAPAHPAVVLAMRLLEARPAHQWTLPELAAELHLTPGYLVRLFKSSTGLPPMAYLARHRVETAAALLLHTDDPVTQIAQAVGWSDQNYFARRFKAHYGLTASAYRRRFARTVVS